MKRLDDSPTATKAVRVAVYCRQSVAEGHAQEFGSLDAQREAVEAYCLSQREAGWVALPEHYDDLGFSGSNTNRPAFKRLIADIEAGLVDAVGVYKFDRLSRSQIDFLRTLELFENHGVSFVSVTQNLDTSTSMGRCMMNIMSAFAQLEREVISERTRDKIRASRRRGLWTGGRPPLGYDVEHKRLVINEPEAAQVRAIFDLYLERRSIVPVVHELNDRGWTTKAWTNKVGTHVPGKPFRKEMLRTLLHTVYYVGRVRAGDEVVDGQHEAIIGEETWDQVQALLHANRPTEPGSPRRPDRHDWPLHGLAHCRCGSGLFVHESYKGTRRYRYAVCVRHHQHGTASCPGSRIAVGKLERLVLDQLRAVGQDPSVVEAAVAAEREANEARRPELEDEKRRLLGRKARVELERRNIVDAIAQGAGSGALTAKLAELDETLADVAEQADQLNADLAGLDSGDVDLEEIGAALADLTELWSELHPPERARLMELLVESIVFDGQAGEIEITLRPGGPGAAALEPAGATA